MQTTTVLCGSKLDHHESGFESHCQQEPCWNEVLVLTTALRRLQMVGTEIDNNILSRIGCESQARHGISASVHDQWSVARAPCAAV